MSNFSKEELLKVAKLSALEIKENEVDAFSSQLQKVLAFVDQIAEVKIANNFVSVSKENVLREDIAVATNPSDIMKLAPKHQENYFIVPKVLNESKGAQ